MSNRFLLRRYVTHRTLADQQMRTGNHNPKYSTRISNVTTDAVIIRRNDWKRMKKEAIHLTPEQRAEIRQKQEAEKQQQLSQIQTKRATMIASEVTPETTFKTHDVLSKTETRDYALQIADAKANEDLDEIKHINSQMTAALARAERDGQLAELAERRAREKEEERQWAEKLEQNRLEGERLYAERERILREQRVRGRAVIQAQIEERKINKILEAERKDREAKALAQQNALIAEEDRRILLDRKKRQQDFLHDCMQANELQRQRKIAEREREKEEAQMVIECQAQKALREAQVEQEKADQRALKEREIAQIRKKQQRAIDTQAIRDETMAIKVQKEREEQERKREEEEMLKAVRMVRQVKNDRDMMIAAKRKRLVEQAAIEQAEHKRVMEANQAAREKARQQWEKKIEADNEYRRELGEEVEREWQRKRIDPAKKVQEAEAAKAANAEYLGRIETLRQKKLDELRAKGVPEKYLVDIMADRFDIK